MNYSRVFSETEIFSKSNQFCIYTLLHDSNINVAIAVILLCSKSLDLQGQIS